MLSHPIMVVIGRNVLVRSELQHILPLRRLPRDANDTISAQSLGKQHPKVTRPPNADDADPLTRPAALPSQGCVRGYAGAQHGGRVLGRQAVGDAEHEARVRPVVVAKPAVRPAGAVWVRRVVRVDLAPAAVVLEADGAVWAVGLQAAAGLGADADTVAEFDVLDIAADADGFSYEFMTDAAGFFSGHADRISSVKPPVK